MASSGYLRALLLEVITFNSSYYYEIKVIMNDIRVGMITEYLTICSLFKYFLWKILFRKLIVSFLQSRISNLN